MEEESTVLELLGLINGSLSVGSGPGSEQSVSNVTVHQTENCIAFRSTLATSGDNPADEKSDGGTCLLNIQRLVRQIGDIDNVVERVGTNIQIDQNEGGISSSLSGNKTGGNNIIYAKQNLQTVEKTDDVVDENVDLKSNTSNSDKRCNILDGQRSTGCVTSVTVNEGEVQDQDSLVGGNNVGTPKNDVQNTLPACHSSGQPNSVDKYCTLTYQQSSAKSHPNINECDPSSTFDDTNAKTLPLNQVAHIAYCAQRLSLKSGQTYIIQKHKMEDLITCPYMCGICGDIFKSTSKLGQHVKNSHSFHTMEKSEIDQTHGGDSNLELPKSNDEIPTISPKAGQPERKDLEDNILENLVQSLPENKSKISKDHQTTLMGDVLGENNDSKSSSKKRKKINGTGGEKQHKKRVKLSAEEPMNMHRPCQKSEDSCTNGFDDKSSSSFRNDAVGLKGDKLEDKGQTKLKNKSRRSFKCEFCEDIFTSNKYRYKHRVAAHPEALFECPGCEKSYTVTEKDKWQHHIRIHNKPPAKPKPESYDCKVCSLVFRAPNAVAIHTQTFHPEAVQVERQFCCEVCGNLFRTRSTLKSHQNLVHSSEKPYQCGTCGKGFKKVSYLKLHQRIHTGEKPFTCKFCDKTFPSSTGRRSHERTHTNERPYKCSYCCNSYRGKAQLVEHERTHTQERPFVCPLCGKSFASRTSFRTHQFLHTGKKPFKCHRCSRSFAQKANLTHHIRGIHSDEKPYECTICSSKFTRSTSRKVHMEKKHGLKITVRQGRPPNYERNQIVDSIIASCMSVDVGSGLSPTEDVTLGDTFSLVVQL